MRRSLRPVPTPRDARAVLPAPAQAERKDQQVDSEGDGVGAQPQGHHRDTWRGREEQENASGQRQDAAQAEQPFGVGPAQPERRREHQRATDDGPGRDQIGEGENNAHRQQQRQNARDQIGGAPSRISPPQRSYRAAARTLATHVRLPAPEI